jgi:hypothetical protein
MALLRRACWTILHTNWCGCEEGGTFCAPVTAATSGEAVLSRAEFEARIYNHHGLKLVNASPLGQKLSSLFTCNMEIALPQNRYSSLSRNVRGGPYLRDAPQRVPSHPPPPQDQHGVATGSPSYIEAQVVFGGCLAP